MSELYGMFEGDKCYGGKKGADNEVVLGGIAEEVALLKQDGQGRL